jgi:hypothetical protein
LETLTGAVHPLAYARQADGEARSCGRLGEGGGVLQRLLVLQMFSLGATQEKTAKVVGRQKQWVNEILKGIPRRVTDGETGKSKR